MSVAKNILFREARRTPEPRANRCSSLETSGRRSQGRGGVEVQEGSSQGWGGDAKTASEVQAGWKRKGGVEMQRWGGFAKDIRVRSKVGWKRKRTASAVLLLSDILTLLKKVLIK